MIRGLYAVALAIGASSGTALAAAHPVAKGAGNPAAMWWIVGLVAVVLFVALAKRGARERMVERDRKWALTEEEIVTLVPAGFIPVNGERVLYGYGTRAWLPTPVSKTSAETRGMIFGGVAVATDTAATTVPSTQLRDRGLAKIVVTNRRVIVYASNDVYDWPLASIVGADFTDPRDMRTKRSPGLLTLSVSNYGRPQFEVFHVSALEGALRMALTGEA
jgi:hypothetical protein